MSSSNLIHWSGLAALVGGVLLAVFDVAEFVVVGGQPESVVAGSGALVVVRVAFLVSGALVLLGLVGLYAHQAEQAGALGWIAFLVAFSGTLMVFGLQWSATFIGPWLAGISPELLDAEPSGMLAAGVMFSLLLLSLGWLLFGLASLRAGVLPRGAAMLMMVGAFLLIVILILELPGSGVLFGAALAWLGYELWSGSGEPAMIGEAAL